MNNDLNKKTVKELRKRVRELHEEGVIDETLKEISIARKAELIEWIEFYDDDDEELQEDGLQHQVIADKTRTAIKSFPVSEDTKPPFSESHEDESENKSEGISGIISERKVKTETSKSMSCSKAT